MFKRDNKNATIGARASFVQLLHWKFSLPKLCRFRFWTVTCRCKKGNRWKKERNLHSRIPPDCVLDVAEDLLGGRELVVHHRTSRINISLVDITIDSGRVSDHSTLASFLSLSCRVRTARSVWCTAVRHFALQKR